MKMTDSLNISKTCTQDRLDAPVSTIFKELPCSSETCQNDSREPTWKCRYVVTIVGFLSLLQGSVHRTIMSIAIVSMVNNTAINKISKIKSESCLHLITNSTGSNISKLSKVEGEFSWSPETQGYILGCYFFGLIIIQIPTARIGERYGLKRLLFWTLLVSGILTLMIPSFSWFSPSAVIVLQTLRGLTQGTTGPCMAILTANWFPKTERGFVFSLMQSAHSLGPFAGNIFSGYVSESPGGWAYTFYTLGASTIALAIYIQYFTFESPKEHPRISQAELNFILSHQESKLLKTRPKLPWSKFLTSIPVYALLFAWLGRHWSLSQFWIVHSTFLGTILHYPIGKNGLLSAIPYMLSFVLSVVSTWISLYLETKNIFSVDFLRKFWSLISSLGYSACLCGISFAGCNRNLSVLFGILSMGLTGLGAPGFMIAAAEMTPTFFGTLHSLCCTISFLSSLILPLVVGYLTDEAQTLEQWNKVFYISIGIVMSSAIAFVIFGSAKIQSWNFVEEEEKSKNTDEGKSEDGKYDEITRF